MTTPGTVTESQMDDAARAFLRELRAMTPSQRERVFEIVRCFYCLRCGNEVGINKPCHCDNDE